MTTIEMSSIAPNSENVIELTEAGIIGLETLCRLCANRTDHLIPIYEGEGAEHELEMKMNRYLPFKVEQSQSMPMHCCYQCASTVLQWHELVEVSLEANRRLRALQEDAIVHLTQKYPKADEHPVGLEIVSDSASKCSTSHKPAQTRAASLISFRQAQSNFTVDFLSQSDKSFTLTPRRLSSNRRKILDSTKNNEISMSQKNKRKSSKDSSSRLNGKTKKGTGSKVSKKDNVVNISENATSNIKTEEMWIKEEIEEEFSKNDNCELNAFNVNVPDVQTEKLLEETCLDTGVDHISDSEIDLISTIAESENIPEQVDRKTTSKKRKPAKIHKCELCNMNFKTVAELRWHSKIHDTLVKKEIVVKEEILDNREINSTEPVETSKIEGDCLCLICMQDIGTETDLEEHRIECHADECEVIDGKTVKKQLCTYCAKVFATKVEVKAHKQLEHPESQRKRSKTDQEAVRKAKVVVEQRTYYRCNECGKNLHSPYTFLWHRRIHTGERPFVCDLCGKQFRVSQGLIRHLRETHAGIKKFACDICGRSFATRRNVEEHRRIHTNERPYVCALCGKAFKQKASLFVHHRSHTDSFPHKCSYCGQGFRTRPPLLVHVTRHTGEKPYPCDVCGRRFRIKYELKRHRLIHSDVKPFKCIECGVSFRQKRYLRNHNKINHNRPTP